MTATAPRTTAAPAQALDPDRPPPAGTVPAAERLFEKIQQGNPRHRAMPADLQGKWEMAEALLGSGLCPKVGRKSDRRDMTVQEVFVMLQLGDELGLAPMQAVQGIAVVEGRPAPMYQVMLAVCRSSGKLEEYREDIDEERAIVTVKRVGDPEPLTATFSHKDAVRAGLLANPTWQKYPRDMMRNRAGGRALKIAFADVLAGIALEDEIEAELADRADAKAAMWTLTPAMVAALNGLVAQKKIPPEEWKRLKLDAAGGARIEVSSVGVPSYTREQWERLEASVRGYVGAAPARGTGAQEERREPEAAPAPAAPPSAEPAAAATSRPSSGWQRLQQIAAEYKATPEQLADAVRKETKKEPGPATEFTEADVEAITNRLDFMTTPPE